MAQIVLQGILKKNSRGTAYLVYSSRTRERRIIRLRANQAALDTQYSGQTVSVVGKWDGKSLKAHKILPCFFPVYRK